jgi:beta-glucosidase
LRTAPAAVNQVRHHALLAHGWGTQAIRAHARADTQVGMVENPVAYIPAIEAEPHITAARTATREENAMFFTVVMEGRYLDSYAKRFGIHYVDFETGRRTPKLSAAWYKEVIRRNALV